jgi:hypothetical protein
MLLVVSDPHYDVSIKGRRPQIKLWPMDLPCRPVVPNDVELDRWVGVRLGRVCLVVGDVRCHLALVRQSICLELGARLSTM